MKQCCIPGCFNKKNLHRVPFGRNDRWQIWLDICPYLSKYSVRQLDNVKICRKHFEPDHITDNLRLNSDAIPSLYLPSKNLTYSTTNSDLSRLQPLHVKYLEVSPLLQGEACNIKVVNDISPLTEINQVMTTCKDKYLEVSPLLHTKPVQSTKSIHTHQDRSSDLERQNNVIEHFPPTISHTDMSLDDQILTSSSSTQVTLSISPVSCNIVSIDDHIPTTSSHTEVGLKQSMTNIHPIEPIVNVIEYTQLSPHPHKDITIDEHIPISCSAMDVHSTEPKVDSVIESEGSEINDLSKTMPSIISHPGQTTPVKSLKRLHENTRIRNKIPRVHLNMNEITPRKQKLRQGYKILRNKFKNLTKKYKKLKSKFQSVSHKIKIFIKKYPILSNFGKLLVDSQLRLSGVKPKGARYTIDEKIFALSLYKMSPKCYRFLRKCKVRLPAQSTIKSILTNVPLRPGINEFLMQHLVDAAKLKDIMGLQCVLLFDEMAINKNLFFNFHTGVIEGFENLGDGKCTHDVADKVLVFMLRGIFSPWKIPIAFYFVRNGIKTMSLKKILKEVIGETYKSGFIVRATVSDQGSANVAAINSLISDTRANLLRSGQTDPCILHYEIDGKVIYHVFDVPHLVKCLRNNFQKKDLLIGDKRAQWAYIERAYAVDGLHGCARSTKLTDKHIKPSSYDKMKVAYAAEVFSKHVSTLLAQQMKTYEHLRRFHDYCVPNVNIDNGFFTAEMILFINDLFDSLNCTGYSKGGLKNALSLNSEHLEFWNKALNKLQSMKFDAADSRESHPLALRNFIHDIKTIKQLWTDLQQIPGVKFLSLKRLNQDPLENFFGQVRGQGGQNTHPNSHQFVALYKTLLINDISGDQSLYANCTNDDDKMLGTLKNLVEKHKCMSTSSDNDSYLDDQSFTLIEKCIPSENVFQTQAISYIAGAVCHFLFPKLDCSNCQNCKDALLSNEIEDFHNLISMKEYDSSNRKLHYPSHKLAALVWECIYIIDKTLPNLCKVYIYTDIINQFKNLDTTWYTCSEHKNDFLNAFWLFVVRMQVKQWCINFNRRIHNVDSRKKGAEMESLIATKVTKGASYRSVRRKSH